MHHLPFIRFFLFLFIFSSCTIQKRIYAPGYYVEFYKSNRKISIVNERNSESKLNDENITRNSTDTGNYDCCKYELTSTIDPNYIYKNEKGFEPLVQNVDLTPEKKKPNHNKLNSKWKSGEKLSNEEKPESKASEKSQVIAFVLCLFLGLLGAHRFYLGYKTFGAIYIAITVIAVLFALMILFYITIGLLLVLAFLLWSIIAIGLIIMWLVDLIRISIGSLKPKNDFYENSSEKKVYPN